MFSISIRKETTRVKIKTLGSENISVILGNQRIDLKVTDVEKNSLLDRPSANHANMLNGEFIELPAQSVSEPTSQLSEPLCE